MNESAARYDVDLGPTVIGGSAESGSSAEGGHATALLDDWLSSLRWEALRFFARHGAPLLRALMIDASAAVKRKADDAETRVSNVFRIDTSMAALEHSVRAMAHRRWDSGRAVLGRTALQDALQLGESLQILSVASAMAKAGVWELRVNVIDTTRATIEIAREVIPVLDWSKAAGWLHRDGRGSWSEEDQDVLRELMNCDDVAIPCPGTFEGLSQALVGQCGFGLRHLYLVFRLATQRTQRLLEGDLGSVLQVMRLAEQRSRADGLECNFGTDDALTAAIRFLTVDIRELDSAPYQPELGVRGYPSLLFQPIIPLGRSLMYTTELLAWSGNVWTTQTRLGLWPIHQRVHEDIRYALNAIRNQRIGPASNDLEARLRTLLLLAGRPFRVNIEPKDSLKELGVQVPPEAGEIDAVLLDLDHHEIWVIEAKDDALFTAPEMLRQSVDKVVHGRPRKGRSELGPSDQEKLSKKVAVISSASERVASCLGGQAADDWTAVGLLVTRVLHPAAGMGPWPVVPFEQLAQLLRVS